MTPTSAYPGADGLPKNVCVPDPKTGGCDRPYHDPHVLNRGGPHTVGNAAEDIAGGRMNGFVHEAEQAQPCGDLTSPWCRKHGKIDVVGYHDAREIPNYWDYARSYVLQDHMFEPSASWSLPAHLFMVSEWSARCANLNPYSCTNELKHPAQPPAFGHTHTAPALYAWTDLTYLLYKHHVSWRYYVMRGGCPPARSNLRTRLRNYLVAVLWGFYADFLRFLRGERRPHCVLQGR